MSQPTHYKTSGGQLVPIDNMHPTHCHAAANKLEASGGDGDTIAALRASADRRAAEFEAAHLAKHGAPYVKKADRS